MTKAVELFIAFVFLLLTPISSENCSTYDPCGNYGYCVDNANYEWQCQCKFWWDGATCDQQSSSGIRVITLGVLTAVSIIIFYGLAIICSIRRKKKQSEPKPTIEYKTDQNNSINPKITDVAFTNVKQSARFSSCLIAVAMLILTALVLIVKWLLLKPIHNELVQKFQTGQPMFYNRSPFCDIIDREDINLLTFPIACFLVLIFILSSKRTSCLKQKLNGYIGPILPIDFYMHIKRKFAVVVFAIISDELLDIINQVLNGENSNGEGVIVLYLLRIAKVLIIGIRYYPILSAVYTDSILALSCATLYAWLDFTISIVSSSTCSSDFYPSNDDFDDTNGTDLITYFTFYGTGPSLIIIQLCTDIPRYVCWSYIAIKLPVLLISKIHHTLKKRSTNERISFHLTREEKILLHSSFPHSVEMRYVRNLFRPIEQRSTSRLFIGRIIPKLIYQWRDDFRFSSRIFCIYASVFLLLYFMTVQICVQNVPGLSLFRKSCQSVIDAVTLVLDSDEEKSIFPLPDFVWPFVLAFLTAFVITIIQLLVLLANIRRNLFQIYSGNDFEIPKRSDSNALSYSTGNFHFAGYFIGYVVWGYALIAFFALIIYICIDAFIVYGSVKFLEIILKKIIPVLLLIIFKQYINKLLARYVFLQDYGQILAINNRRSLMIFLYFNFFLDAFLGVVSSIVRIIKSVIGGILYMGRLDYSPLGRKLESFDAGFTAYCGFIHLEAIHRNPLVLAVASYLYNRMKAKQYAKKNSPVNIDNRNQIGVKNYSTGAIRKWHLAILLIQNPSLKVLRTHKLLRIENGNLNKIDQTKRKYSYSVDNYHRPSLVSETDLKNAWQNI